MMSFSFLIPNLLNYFDKNIHIAPIDMFDKTVEKNLEILIDSYNKNDEDFGEKVREYTQRFYTINDQLIDTLFDWISTLTSYTQQQPKVLQTELVKYTDELNSADVDLSGYVIRKDFLNDLLVSSNNNIGSTILFLMLMTEIFTSLTKPQDDNQKEDFDDMVVYLENLRKAQQVKNYLNGDNSLPVYLDNEIIKSFLSLSELKTITAASQISQTIEKEDIEKGLLVDVINTTNIIDIKTNTTNTNTSLTNENGVMLAIKVPIDIATKYSVSGGTTPEDMHITLFYFGKDVSSLSLDKTRQILDKETKALKNFSVVIKEADCFPPSESSDYKEVAIFSVFSRGLLLLRNILFELFEDNDIEFSKNFLDYRPHITLAYLDSGEMHPYEFKTINEEFLVENIGLYYKGQKIYWYRFGQGLEKVEHISDN